MFSEKGTDRIISYVEHLGLSNVPESDLVLKGYLNEAGNSAINGQMLKDIIQKKRSIIIRPLFLDVVVKNFLEIEIYEIEKYYKNSVLDYQPYRVQLFNESKQLIDINDYTNTNEGVFF